MKEIKISLGMVALVDDDDFKWLSQWNWFARKNKETFYAIRNKRRRRKSPRGMIYMHREILGLKVGDGVKVDHKDRNGLNNQKTKST